jgi:hypothetical protein
MTISVSWIIAKGIKKGSMFVIVFSSSESGVVVTKLFPSFVFATLFKLYRFVINEAIKKD